MDMESLSLNGAISDLHVTTPQVNGSYSPNESSIEMNGTEVEISAKEEGGAPTYADAFPPLPAAPPLATGSGKSSWGKPSKAKQPISQNKSIQSSTSSQVFKIPFEERKYKNLSPIVGDAEKQNEIIRDVMQRTSSKIEVTVTKDQSLTIMVSGKREACAQARRLITSGLQTQASIEMVIPKEHHKFILGKGGKKLQDLELQSQTKITIPRDSEIIRIVGTKEGIDRAKHEMQVVSDEQAKLAFERLNIPKMFHPFICGPDNENSKEIASISGARINVPPPSVNKDELTIAGDKENVQKAVNMIMDIFKDRQRKCKTVSVEVKKAQHRYVIGARGSGIQDILRQTNVSVEMPPLDSENETITLRGDQDQLGRALTMVYDRASSVETKELAAPKWLHRFIIGRKGQNIKKITQDLDNKVRIEFLEDKDKIVIEGPPTEVQAASTLLSSSLKDLQNTMSYTEIQVDQKWHRHIIGKNGSNINRIKNETGTSINIPSDNEKSDIIRIEGSPDGVDFAKHAIMDMASKMENEKSRDIIIEHKYHKNIIGQKGDKVKEIREKFPQVQISFPEAGKQSDIVTLRGPREEVDKCYTFLKKLATEIISSNYRLEVPILKRFHGNVIGRNGANIRKIKDETDTTIEIPAETSDSDIILVIGYKEKCHKAKEMILAIQSELANIVSKDIKIPQKLHTSMIGMGGKFIRSITSECGDVNIRFPTEGSNSDVITVRGTTEDVEKAEQQLLKLAEERLESSFTAEVTAKPEHHRFLIGKGGINIRKVREKTGVRIIFPTRQDENRELITIIGKKEAVEEAKKELNSKIKDLNNIVEGEVTIDPKHHRYLASRRAQVLREVSDEYGGVSISLPKENTSAKVALKGAKDCVEGAKSRLLEIISDLESMIEIKCVIAQKHHRNILGNKGRNVQELTSRLNVQIKFPERRRNDAEEDPAVIESTDEENKNDVIMISGKKENAEEARDCLLALVPVTKEIEIPYGNHRYIIGQKGSGIRKMMEEFDVNISVPPAENNEDFIRVTGPIKHVEKALLALEQRNDEIEGENADRRMRSFELVVDVPNKYHSKLIGRKGETIQKMRNEYGVNINVPPPGSDNNADQITLTGYEDKCKVAADAILKIIQDMEDQLTIEVSIDNRIHSRIIGQRGKTVKKLMERFKVDIRFPRNQENPNVVFITGLEDDCETCKEHLLLLEEEYMDEVRDRIEEKELMQKHMRPSRTNESGGPNRPSGYMVRDAPWSQQQGGQQQQQQQWEPQQPQQQQQNQINQIEYQADADNTSDFPNLSSKGAGGEQGKVWGPWGGQ